MNEGIRNKDGEYEFDWQNDLPDDILTLRFPKNKLSRRKISGISVSYFYKTSKKSCPSIKKDFLVWLKSKDNPRIEIQNFVQRALISLNSVYDLNSFDVILFPPSSSILLKRIEIYLKRRHAIPLFYSDLFVKDTSTIDISGLEELLRKESLPQGFRKYVANVVTYIRNNKTIELKRIPKMFLRYIHDFIIPNKEYSIILRIIDNSKVLIIDDYCFTGTTLIDINKQVAKFNPKQIVNFCLISN